MVAGWASLTRREREVAACIAHGLDTFGCAARLGISPRTVKHYKWRMARKVGIPPGRKPMVGAALAVHIVIHWPWCGGGAQQPPQAGEG